ncbi:MAG: chemotaxis protein CheX [Candidatus Sericytochromatia bacterium]
MNLEFDFITPFYLGAKDVFEQMFNTKVNVSQINHIETNLTLDDITVDLELKSNNFTGKVYYFMSKKFVLETLTAMMGFTPELDMESEMTKSALLELNNMITGKALTKLAEMGTSYNMSVPEIIVGKDEPLNETPISLSLVTLDSSGSLFTIGFLTSSIEKIVKPGPKRLNPIDTKSLLNQIKTVTQHSIKEVSEIKGEHALLLRKGDIAIKMAHNAINTLKIKDFEEAMSTIPDVKSLMSQTLDELKVSKGDHNYIIRKNEVISDLAKVMLDILLATMD